MNIDVASMIQWSVFTLWNLFPNGTMIFATWISCHVTDVLLPDEVAEEQWIPLSVNKKGSHL